MRHLTRQQVAEAVKRRERRAAQAREVAAQRAVRLAEDRAHLARQAKAAAEHRQREAEGIARSALNQMRGLEARFRALHLPLDIALNTRSVLALSEQAFYGGGGLCSPAEVLAMFKREIRHRIAHELADQIMGEVDRLIAGAPTLADLAAALRPFALLQYHTALHGVIDLEQAVREGYFAH